MDDQGDDQLIPDTDVVVHDGPTRCRMVGMASLCRRALDLPKRAQGPPNPQVPGGTPIASARRAPSDWLKGRYLWSPSNNVPTHPSPIQST